MRLLGSLVIRTESGSHSFIEDVCASFSGGGEAWGESKKMVDKDRTRDTRLESQCVSFET